MAANATAVWRVRPSGSNNNGGGFDCAISSGATGTNGSFTGTTFTDATAAAFVAGMVGSAINIAGVGQYLITALIDPSNITLGSGNPGVTLSGGMAWTVGSGQDYSQQNGVQVTQSGGTVSTATTTLTDTGASFTAALIGNAIRVAGAGITTTYTYITAVPSGTTLTLQTSPGAAGTSVTFNIGGAWADPFTNTTAAAAWLVPGNRVYLLGSGTPNPASYTYDYTLSGAFSPAQGSQTVGQISFENDPGTPGYKAPPDTTGGMPVIKQTNVNGFNSMSYNKLIGLYFVAGANGLTTATNAGGARNTCVFGCVADQLTFTGYIFTSSIEAIIGCEVFCSTGTTGGTSYVCINNQYNTIGNNFHDINGGAINTNTGGIIANNIIAKCQLDGIKFTTAAQSPLIINNTIDGNLGHGIEVTNQSALQRWMVLNNIISNHSVAGKFGVTTAGTGTTVGNTSMAMLFDYNVYYNNTADLSGLSYGPHDTHGGSNPFVGQSTENYTLA